ncbi:DUF2635 domain-containing protein [Muricoccus vinaceus]|uniref:DUF2635 domain-containing protein n=1 Tax=Muricoccus vinaceus TaxID=424704 RepID=A0ABV6IL36_9PROT
MIIIPKPGLSIKDPDQQDIIPAEGRAVANTEYWFRRLIDGDVTMAPAGYTPVRPIFQETASGTTAQRPNPAKAGDFRHNTELKAPEMFVGAPVGWLVFDGGASGAAAAGQAAGEAAGAAAAQAALQGTASAIRAINENLAGTNSAVEIVNANLRAEIAAQRATIEALQGQVADLLAGGTPPVTTRPVGLTAPVIIAPSLDLPLGLSVPVIVA